MTDPPALLEVGRLRESREESAILLEQMQNAVTKPILNYLDLQLILKVA